MIPGDRNNHKWPWRNASLRRRPSFHFLWSLAFLQRHHQKVMCKMKCEAQCASGSSKFLILCTATRAHQQQATIAFPSSHQHHVVVSFGVLMSRESRRWLNCFFFPSRAAVSFSRIPNATLCTAQGCFWCVTHWREMDIRTVSRFCHPHSWKLAFAIRC